MLTTARLCPCKCKHYPVCKSHNFTVWSSLPLASLRSLGSKAIACTCLLCLLSVKRRSSVSACQSLTVPSSIPLTKHYSTGLKVTNATQLTSDSITLKHCPVANFCHQLPSCAATKSRIYLVLASTQLNWELRHRKTKD